MRRYARELSSALQALNPARWQFDLVQPEKNRWISALWNHTLAARVESAVDRYAVYPLAVRRLAANTFHVLDHAYGHLVSALDPARTIVTCHDLIPLLSADGRIPIDVPAGVVRTVRFRIRQMTRAARVIAISDATRRTLLEYTDIPPSRIRVIGYGVNQVFQPAGPEAMEASRSRLGIPSGARVILQVATRGRYKNTPGLLRGLALARKRLGEGAILARVGVPLYEDEAELARRLGVFDAIRYVGMVNNDRELAEWYRCAAVLAFPSFWEGFGWPPLEAMASGTPVVASAIPAIREVVQDAAVLIDPHDENALADALTRVISDEAYARQLRNLGLQRARQLTWAETARRTLELYDEIAGAGEAAA
jgi:glycosyltransferase involved in cell wall biosynthesis